jgi:1,2-diacylglycerol 3-beta-glucosyltransferase
VHLALNLSLLVIALPAVFSCAYLFVLTLLSARNPVPASAARQIRFDIIVPAHNEEIVIANVVRSLKAVDWPADKFRVIVVADNCTDATAAIARAAGAYVLDRTNSEKRGKGYALQFAFAASRTDSWADAVAVVDADAEVSANFIEAIASRMERGEQAVQVHYGILNIHASWRTRLLSIAKGAFHIVRSRARERLRLSCGIRGNGWSVTHSLLEKVPYAAFSLTEDLEYGITLGMKGYRVAYADEAHSDAEMVAGEKDSRKQRQRWEHGRFSLVRSCTLPLLGQAIRKGSPVCLDLAFDLLVPAMSYVALNVAALLTMATVSAITGGSMAWVWVGLACLVALLLHILRGWQVSGSGMQGLLDLARAPGFVIWKLVIMLRGGGTKEWVRTKRGGS